jgi:hypothetical protein
MHCGPPKGSGRRREVGGSFAALGLAMDTDLAAYEDHAGGSRTSDPTLPPAWVVGDTNPGGRFLATSFSDLDKDGRVQGGLQGRDRHQRWVSDVDAGVRRPYWASGAEPRTPRGSHTRPPHPLAGKWIGGHREDGTRVASALFLPPPAADLGRKRSRPRRKSSNFARG